MSGFESRRIEFSSKVSNDLAIEAVLAGLAGQPSGLRQQHQARPGQIGLNSACPALNPPLSGRTLGGGTLLRVHHHHPLEHGTSASSCSVSVPARNQAFLTIWPAQYDHFEHLSQPEQPLSSWSIPTLLNLFSSLSKLNFLSLPASPCRRSLCTLPGRFERCAGRRVVCTTLDESILLGSGPALEHLLD